jgi:eukaryotic-like serine/threonine-protein kinase
MLRMSLTTGTRLGPYEILGPIGAGGMGEVYRARDTRLGRTVAIKVLPSHLSDNAALKQRFEREARTISSLSHPHICALHDIGSQDGIDFLVMEYLEGQTLADRIQKGALPTEQLMRFGVEIADALVLRMTTSARCAKQSITQTATAIPLWAIVLPEAG